jgi:dihydrolipoamide dehydrogenase
VGPGAGELVAEGVLAIEMGCTVRDLTASIHPHPTLSETLGAAGEVYLGVATDIYKPKRAGQHA